MSRLNNGTKVCDYRAPINDRCHSFPVWVRNPAQTSATGVTPKERLGPNCAEVVSGIASRQKDITLQILGMQSELQTKEHEKVEWLGRNASAGNITGLNLKGGDYAKCISSK